MEQLSNRTTFGFGIYPSQTLSAKDVETLQKDVISLLSSLAYHPPGVTKTTLDLRHLVVKDASLAKRRFDVVLLVCLTFNSDQVASVAEQIRSDFQKQFYNLLSLHLSQYEFRIEALDEATLSRFIQPFSVFEIVEITRRITSRRPFSLSHFRGSSTMSKIVDMLLREEGQYYLSVLLEPHQLTEEEVASMEAFGYKSGTLPELIEKELLQGIPGLQAQTEAMFSSFKMKIRLVSDCDISQYIINLVGSEISGQTDFFHLRLTDTSPKFAAEASDLANLTFNCTILDFISVQVPQILLNSVYVFQPDEVSRAFRFPTQRISTSREKQYKTYHAPLTTLSTSGLLLGTAEHPSLRERVPVYLEPKDRKRHMYVVGKTGTGKSMMLLNMLKQDVQSQGVCLMDPHGDLIEAVFPFIPAERKDDVYLFDPSDKEYISGFNFLETTPTTTAEEKDHIIQELLSMILRSVDYEFAMFGPMAQQWTRYGCLTLMDTPEGGTLLEVPRLFTDSDFRKDVLTRVKDPTLIAWWENQFNKTSDFHKSEMMGYFTSKFEPLVGGPQVRNVTSRKTSTFKFKEMVDGKKILLVNLARGKLGGGHSAFLGSLILSRLLWTIMQRAWQPEAAREEFYLYVDEFQNFVTDSFEPMLSETRKYGLNLIVAHQHLEQLTAMSKLGSKIERAVFGNVGTIVCFRVGTDAEKLAKELGTPVDELTLRHLENRYAVIGLLVNDAPAVPFTMRTTDWVPPSSEEQLLGQQIRQAARERGEKSSIIAEEIRSRHDAVRT